MVDIVSWFRASRAATRRTWARVVTTAVLSILGMPVGLVIGDAWGTVAMLVFVATFLVAHTVIFGVIAERDAARAAAGSRVAAMPP